MIPLGETRHLIYISNLLNRWTRSG